MGNIWTIFREHPGCIHTDTEKFASMQAWLADNIWEKCGHFCINKEFFAVFAHQLPQVSIIYPRLIFFPSKTSNVSEKISILVTFLWLGNTWICGHFSILKNRLRTKINFFHVCSWLVHDLFMTCSLLVHDLFITSL